MNPLFLLLVAVLCSDIITSKHTTPHAKVFHTLQDESPCELVDRSSKCSQKGEDCKFAWLGDGKCILSSLGTFPSRKACQRACDCSACDDPGNCDPMLHYRPQKSCCKVCPSRTEGSGDKTFRIGFTGKFEKSCADVGDVTSMFYTELRAVVVDDNNVVDFSPRPYCWCGDEDNGSQVKCVAVFRGVSDTEISDLQQLSTDSALKRSLKPLGLRRDGTTTEEGPYAGTKCSSNVECVGTEPDMYCLTKNRQQGCARFGQCTPYAQENDRCSIADNEAGCGVMCASDLVCTEKANRDACAFPTEPTGEGGATDMDAEITLFVGTQFEMDATCDDADKQASKVTRMWRDIVKDVTGTSDLVTKVAEFTCERSENAHGSVIVLLKSSQRNLDSVVGNVRSGDVRLDRAVSEFNSGKQGLIINSVNFFEGRYDRCRRASCPETAPCQALIVRSDADCCVACDSADAMFRHEDDTGEPFPDPNPCWTVRCDTGRYCETLENNDGTKTAACVIPARFSAILRLRKAERSCAEIAVRLEEDYYTLMSNVFDITLPEQDRNGIVDMYVDIESCEDEDVEEVSKLRAQDTVANAKLQVVFSVALLPSAVRTFIAVVQSADFKKTLEEHTTNRGYGKVIGSISPFDGTRGALCKTNADCKSALTTLWCTADSASPEHKKLKMIKQGINTGALGTCVAYKQEGASCGGRNYNNVCASSYMCGPTLSSSLQGGICLRVCQDSTGCRNNQNCQYMEFDIEMDPSTGVAQPHMLTPQYQVCAPEAYVCYSDSECPSGFVCDMPIGIPLPSGEPVEAEPPMGYCRRAPKPPTYNPRCPKVTDTTIGICISQCASDADCESDYICCATGCGGATSCLKKPVYEGDTCDLKTGHPCTDEQYCQSFLHMFTAEGLHAVSGGPGMATDGTTSIAPFNPDGTGWCQILPGVGGACGGMMYPVRCATDLICAGPVVAVAADDFSKHSCHKPCGSTSDCQPLYECRPVSQASTDDMWISFPEGNDDPRICVYVDPCENVQCAKRQSCQWTRIATPCASADMCDPNAFEIETKCVDDAPNPRCPAEPVINVSMCVGEDHCTDPTTKDGCAGTSICCSNGCGYSCMTPQAREFDPCNTVDVPDTCGPNYWCRTSFPNIFDPATGEDPNHHLPEMTAAGLAPFGAYCAHFQPEDFPCGGMSPESQLRCEPKLVCAGPVDNIFADNFSAHKCYKPCQDETQCADNQLCTPITDLGIGPLFDSEAKNFCVDKTCEDIECKDDQHCKMVKQPPIYCIRAPCIQHPPLPTCIDNSADPCFVWTCPNGERCDTRTLDDGTLEPHCVPQWWSPACLLPLHNTDSLAMRLTRYYFNYEERECEKFSYGGGDLNKNHFQTMQACEAACAPKECPKRMQWSSCASACPLECPTGPVEDPIACPAVCSDGCVCSGRYPYLNADGKCVQRSECPGMADNSCTDDCENCITHNTREICVETLELTIGLFTEMDCESILEQNVLTRVLYEALSTFNEVGEDDLLEMRARCREVFLTAEEGKAKPQGAEPFARLVEIVFDILTGRSRAAQFEKAMWDSEFADGLNQHLSHLGKFAGVRRVYRGAKRGCPDNKSVYSCFEDPCARTTCPAYPNAKCHADYCEGCNFRYITEAGRDVTEKCFTKPPVGCSSDSNCGRNQFCVRCGLNAVGSCISYQNIGGPCNGHSQCEFQQRCAKGSYCLEEWLAIGIADAPGVCVPNSRPKCPAQTSSGSVNVVNDLEQFRKECVDARDLCSSDRQCTSGTLCCRTGCVLECVCPDGAQPVNCFQDPCETPAAVCPGNPLAQCRANYCGGCEFDFYYAGNIVDCSETFENPCNLVDCRESCTVVRGEPVCVEILEFEVETDRPCQEVLREFDTNREEEFTHLLRKLFGTDVGGSAVVSVRARCALLSEPEGKFHKQGSVEDDEILVLDIETGDADLLKERADAQEFREAFSKFVHEFITGLGAAIRRIISRADRIARNVCELPLETGEDPACETDAIFIRYYFNAEEGECEEFEWTGCSRNANNFETLEACQRHCDWGLVCPENDVITICSVMEDACFDDAECEDHQLCCSVGCGRKCVAGRKPIFPPFPVGCAAVLCMEGTECIETPEGHAICAAGVEAVMDIHSSWGCDLISALLEPVADTIGRAIRDLAGFSAKDRLGITFRCATEEDLVELPDSKIVPQGNTELAILVVEMTSAYPDRLIKAIENSRFMDVMNKFFSEVIRFEFSALRIVRRIRATRDICTLPKVVGPCEALIPSWYFDRERNECVEFNYGGCQGNDNRFNTEAACEARCPAKGCATDCSMKCFVGTCEDGVTQFGCTGECYIPPTGAPTCVTPRSVCKQKPKCCDPAREPGVNGNPYCFEGHDCCPNTGEWSCSIGDGKTFSCGNVLIENPGGKACKPSLCDSVRCVTGVCVERLQETTCDVATGDCVATFTADCVDDLDEPNACSLPAQSGTCRAAIPRWYYNEKSHQCEQFTYGGCGGNPNNFETKAACMLRCDADVIQTCTECAEQNCITGRTPRPCFDSKGNADTKNCELTAACTICPLGVNEVWCFADPCQVTKCTNFPEAKCRSNYCGGCNAEFFNDAGEQVECD